MEGNGKIHEAIAAIMDEVGGVGKTRTNAQQGYKYRGIADVALACQPIMAKHQVHATPHAILNEVADYLDTKSGGKMLHVRQTIEYRFYHADGSFFPCVVTGEAMDSGDKTSNKVMSAALKYALTQTFCIPETDPDADTEAQSPQRVDAPKQAEQPKPVAGQPAHWCKVHNTEFFKKGKMKEYAHPIAGTGDAQGKNLQWCNEPEGPQVNDPNSPEVPAPITGEPPSTPEMSTKTQHQFIRERLDTLGVDHDQYERASKVSVLAGIKGEAVTGLNKLTYEQAVTVVQQLDKEITMRGLVI